jgi:hypothetical protein
MLCLISAFPRALIFFVERFEKKLTESGLADRPRLQWLCSCAYV